MLQQDQFVPPAFRLFQPNLELVFPAFWLGNAKNELQATGSSPFRSRSGSVYHHFDESDSGKSKQTTNLKRQTMAVRRFVVLHSSRQPGLGFTLCRPYTVRKLAETPTRDLAA